MFKKLVIIGIVIFIGIIGLGFIYLNNIYIPKHLKPMVIDIMEKNLGKSVDIDKAFYFPFKGVLFSGIYVQNTDGSVFLEIEKVDLSLKSFPKIRTNQASIKARLIVKGAALNQQGITVRGGSVVDIDLEFEENKQLVFNGNIKLDDLEVKGINSITDINKINGFIICDQESFTSSKLNAYIGQQQLNLFIDGKYSNNDINLNKLKIDYGKTNLELKAKIDDFTQLNIEASAEGLIDLVDIKRVLSIETLPLLKGRCSITADAAGAISDFNSIKAKAYTEIKQGSVDKIKFSDLKANINFEHAAVNIAPLTCIFYDGKISASAKAEIKNTIPIQCSIDIEQVSLEPLIKDIINQDIGTGQFNAHAGISGSAMDINNMTGSGWFKIEQASIKPPANFKKVARSLKVPELSDMRIEQSSATFSLIDGKVYTEDFIAIADYATIYGKGYIDLEQYVDFETKFKLSEQFKQSLGDWGTIANIAADGAKVRLYDKISQLKYKPEFSKKEIIKSLLNQNNGAGQDQPDKIDFKKQLKKEFRKLFK